MRLALVRHPETDIPPGVCYGRLDAGLSPAGWAAIPGMLAGLADLRPAAVRSSPARRCRAVADAWGPGVTLDERLLELDFGDWEGKRWDSIPRAALDRWAADPAGEAPPRGETGAALLARVRACLADLPLDEDCILITHGGPLKLLTALALGHPADLLAPAPPLGSVKILKL